MMAKRRYRSPGLRRQADVCEYLGLNMPHRDETGGEGYAYGERMPDSEGHPFLTLESKMVKTLPKTLTRWLDQAERTEGKSPLVAITETGIRNVARGYAVLRLDDLRDIVPPMIWMGMTRAPLPDAVEAVMQRVERLVESSNGSPALREWSLLREQYRLYKEWRRNVDSHYGG